MKANEDIWRKRYRTLERQLEDIFVAFRDVLEDVERHSKAPIDTRIDKIAFADLKSRKYLYCVATGTDLAYEFKIMKSGTILASQEFGRMNAIDVTEITGQGKCTCEIRVVSYRNRKTAKLQRSVDL